MKKILPILILVLSAFALRAQTPAAAPVKPGQQPQKTDLKEAAAGYYCCRFCDYTALNLRSCPVHQAALIKVGTWYCPKDGRTYAKTGSCQHDQTPLVRMEMKYKTATPKPADMKTAEPVKQ